MTSPWRKPALAVLLLLAAGVAWWLLGTSTRTLSPAASYVGANACAACQAVASKAGAEGASKMEAAK